MKIPYEKYVLEAKDEKIEQLEAKIKSKNDVMAELLEDFRG